MKLFILGAILIHVTNANAGSLNLAWNIPSQDRSLTDHPGSVLIYSVYSKAAGGTATYNYSNPSWNGSQPPARISGLQSNGQYCFVIRALNSISNLYSPDSNEVCGRVPKLNPPSGFQLIDFQAELNLGNGLIHYIGYYSNSETGESMTMETTEKFSDL